MPEPSFDDTAIKEASPGGLYLAMKAIVRRFEELAKTADKSHPYYGNLQGTFQGEAQRVQEAASKMDYLYFRERTDLK